MAPLAGPVILFADVDVVILFVEVGEAGTDKGCVRLAYNTPSLLRMMGLALLPSGLAMQDDLVALRRPIPPLLLAPTRGRTFDPVNLQVDELRCQPLKVFLGVELGLLTTARLVKEEGVNKDHGKDGKVYARRPVPRPDAPVDAAHFADAIVAVNHPAL